MNQQVYFADSATKYFHFPVLCVQDVTVLAFIVVLLLFSNITFDQKISAEEVGSASSTLSIKYQGILGQP